MGVWIIDSDGNEIENTSKKEEKPLRDEYQKPAEGYVEPGLQEIVPDRDKYRKNDKWHPGLDIRP